MGSEVFLGGVSWLGAATLVTLLVLCACKPVFRLYALLVALPGLVLAIVSVQGQVCVARILGLSLAFFLIGALVLGAPLAGLCWFWLRHRITRHGTLQ
jgi:hypothetical protein